jgi:rRNA maturation protein Rpf1
MKVYKTYNLKLDEEAYFKLREIELEFEKDNSKKKNKSEIISIIIKDFKTGKKNKSQTSILD